MFFWATASLPHVDGTRVAMAVGIAGTVGVRGVGEGGGAHDGVEERSVRVGVGPALLADRVFVLVVTVAGILVLRVVIWAPASLQMYSLLAGGSARASPVWYKNTSLEDEG